MELLKDRLIWARQRSGMTMTELAGLSECSFGAIGNLEKGIRLSAQNIVLIALALDVDPLWLSHGRGCHFAHKITRVDSALHDGVSMTLSEQEVRFLLAYRYAGESEKIMFDVALAASQSADLSIKKTG